LASGAPCSSSRRLLEPDVAKRRARGFSEELAELPLQRAAGQAGGLGQFVHAPVVSGIGAHRVERAADAARQQ